jgi:hypothetical protein
MVKEFIPGCAHPGGGWVCFLKVKGLFEAKKHPTKCLLFIIKSCFRRAKYFYLLGFSLNMGSGAKKNTDTSSLSITGRIHGCSIMPMCKARLIK